LPKSRGPRSKTRRLFSKSLSRKGLRSLGYLLKDYEVGDKVVITIDPAVHRGMPYKRFHGSVGQVVEKRGRAYVVKVTTGRKEKLILARPEHIRPVSS